MKLQIKNSESKTLIYISISRSEIISCKYIFIIMHYQVFFNNKLNKEDLSTAIACKLRI